jgi:hypothetical protein
VTGRQVSPQKTGVVRQRSSSLVAGEKTVVSAMVRSTPTRVPVTMGNYVIRVGNYMTAKPPHWEFRDLGIIGLGLSAVWVP